jgi:hypothetical protein
MDVINVGTVRGITLDDNANFRGLVGVDVTLQPDENIRVCSDGTKWRALGAKGT